MINEAKIRQAVRLMLEGIGEDPDREGLLETPDRVARMYAETMSGYEEDASKHLSKVFTVQDNDMVMVKDITFFSTCEHHLMPFFGVAHVAYIPNGKVVGISKLARTVETYARRLQIQERLTEQIAEAVMKDLNAAGVCVMLEAEHTCMTMRGVKKPGSKTVTLAQKGAFENDETLQNRFFRLLGR